MRRVAAATLVLLLCGGRPVHASPWMRSGGEALIATSISLSQDNQFWTPEGFLVPRESHNQLVASVHYERGYSYYYTLIAGGAYKYRDGNSGVDKGPSSLRVGIRGRLQKFRNGRTWQATAILPTQPVGSDPEDPGEGKFGLHVGLFYRLLPDPYEKPFTKFPFGVWGGGIGILTLRSGDAVDELQAFGTWSKNFSKTPYGVQMKWSGLTSIFEGPLVIPYARFQSEGSISYALKRGEGINISYGVDILGRNITQSNALKIGFSHRWE